MKILLMRGKINTIIKVIIINFIIFDEKPNKKTLIFYKNKIKSNDDAPMKQDEKIYTIACIYKN